MATIPDDYVFVTYGEQWDLRTYVQRYLSTRRIPLSEDAFAHVERCLEGYLGNRPLRKSDLDYFLDANLRRAG